jgi:hypothetical protein
MEKHKKFTQSKFDIFVLHKHFSGFYKGNRGQNEEIYTDLKKFTQTWFAGLRVFPCLQVLGFAKPREDVTIQLDIGYLGRIFVSWENHILGFALDMVRVCAKKHAVRGIKVLTDIKHDLQWLSSWDS